MKKKKGFTLIELLAVIVILAIIALIATPIVLNIIKTSRKGAFARSAEGVLKASKLYYTSSLMEEVTPKEQEFTCDNKTCITESNIKLDVDGSVGEGNVKITSDGKISFELGNGTYCAEKEEDSDKITITEKKCLTSIDDSEEKETLENKTYTTGDAVTFGGYNWHVIGDTGTKVTLLMDALQLGENNNMRHCTDDLDDSTDCIVYRPGNGNEYYQYSWDKSLIRTYLNGEFLTNLESKITNEIVSTPICADSSRGDGVVTYGGYLIDELEALGKTSLCSNKVSDKVRLISYSEYFNMTPRYKNTNDNFPNIENIIKLSTDSDYESWLYCNFNSCDTQFETWWMMTADYNSISKSYNQVRLLRAVGIDGSWYSREASSEYGVRPVITIVK